MSSQELNREFTDFGKKMNTIAILTLIGLIGTLIGMFSFIGSLISIIMSIIIIIFFLIVIGSIKRAGRLLNNENLLGFPLKFILGTIIRVIGMLFFQIGLSILLNILFYGGTMAIFTISIVLFLIGIALIEIGSVLRLLAWGGLKSFFEANVQLFPPEISDAGRSGAKLCKIACIIDMVIFIPFVGDILRILGYFKLAKLRYLVGGPAQPTYQPTYQPPAPQPTPISGASANYCPNCGTSIVSGARYCPDCGAEMS